ncbi:hypothetical protein PHMEG_00034976, partial [Phytophthora megakarya]
MGHVDGLSRLPAERVASLAMADLLNPANEPFGEDPPEPEGDPEPVMTDVLDSMSETEFDVDFSDEETKEGEEDE